MSEAPSHTPHDIDAVQVFDTVANSREYLTNRQLGYSTKRAFARSALQLAGMERGQRYEDEYEPDTKNMTKEMALNAMVGTLPSFVYGLEGIRHHHEIAKHDYRTYRSLRARAARFNHAAKALIYQDPSISFGSLSSTITSLYGAMNRDRWDGNPDGYTKEARWFKGQIEGVLRGMYQEVAAARVIQAIENADVSVDSHVSAKDDLDGADLYVTLDGVTFPVDIKASERTARASREKSRRPCAVITSGLPSPTHGDTFAIDPAMASQAADAMLDKLYDARTEFLATQLEKALA